ncbi:MAG: hypothetical protein ACE5HV_08195 [Acidobacteriota bacterium]
MPGLFSLLCAASLCFPGNFPASQGVDPQARRIGKIEIIANDVFENGKWAEFLAFRAANKLHIRTRENIIRQELLFSSGDPLDAEELAQSERNLRALRFLRDARIETIPSTREGEENEVVDLRVTTWDVWTTSPEISFAKVGNKSTSTLGFSESNLLGRGKRIEFSRRSNLERDDTVVGFRDPRLAGSRFMLAGAFSDRSDGSGTTFELQRPFFSLETGWALRLRQENFDQVDPLYAAGERVGQLRHVRRLTEVGFSRALVRRPSSALRFHLGYRNQEDQVGGGLRDFGTMEVGVSSEEHRFIQLTHVNRFERTEDFNLGRESAAFVGVSTPWLGGEQGTDLFFSLSHQRGFRLGPEHFFLGRVTWQARRRRDRLENSLALARLTYVNKLSARRLLIATAELRYGSRLDPEVQLTLGAESGLRGYPVHQWVGNRSLLVSAEKRWFLADDVGQLASFGVAAFVDSGFAWPEGQSLDLRDMKTNLGIGLLLGRNRLATGQPTLRFDLAYALDPVRDHGRWVFLTGSRIGL